MADQTGANHFARQLDVAITNVNGVAVGVVAGCAGGGWIVVIAGSVVIAEDLDAAVRLRDAAPGWTVVTLAGEVLGVLVEGLLEKAQRGRREREDVIGVAAHLGAGGAARVGTR